MVNNPPNSGGARRKENQSVASSTPQAALNKRHPPKDLRNDFFGRFVPPVVDEQCVASTSGVNSVPRRNGYREIGSGGVYRRTADRHTLEYPPRVNEPRDEMKVCTSCLNSPAEFYVQLHEEMSEIDSLLGQLADAYTDYDLPLAAGDIRPGVACVAMFSELRTFCRGEVVSREVNGQLLVKFVDYGHVELKAEHELKPLVQRFAVTPPHALRCCCIGFSKANDGDVDVNQAFRARVHLASHLLICTFKTTSEPYQVTLRTSKGVDVLADLAPSGDTGALLTKVRLSDEDIEKLQEYLNTVGVGSSQTRASAPFSVGGLRADTCCLEEIPVLPEMPEFGIASHVLTTNRGHIVCESTSLGVMQTQVLTFDVEAFLRGLSEGERRRLPPAKELFLRDYVAEGTAVRFRRNKREVESFQRISPARTGVGFVAQIKSEGYGYLWTAAGFVFFRTAQVQPHPTVPMGSLVGCAVKAVYCRDVPNAQCPYRAITVYTGTDVETSGFAKNAATQVLLPVKLTTALMQRTPDRKTVAALAKLAGYSKMCGAILERERAARGDSG